MITWIKEDDYLQRGLLRWDDTTTLFLLGKEESGYYLAGAVVPDAEERFAYDEEEVAKLVAEQFLINWVRKHSERILNGGISDFGWVGDLNDAGDSDDVRKEGS